MLRKNIRHNSHLVFYGEMNAYACLNIIYQTHHPKSTLLLAHLPEATVPNDENLRGKP